MLDGVVLNPIRYKILLEVLARGNYTRVEEVPFVFEERAQGGSKIGFKYLVHLVRISLETGEATRMIKFALVGLSGVVVNFFCYRLLIAVPGWTVWGAASGAAGLAVVNNFIWNERFTFWETHRATPDWGHVLQRFLAFTGFSFGGFLLNIGLVSLLVGRLGVPWVPGGCGISLRILV